MKEKELKDFISRENNREFNGTPKYRYLYVKEKDGYIRLKMKPQITFNDIQRKAISNYLAYKYTYRRCSNCSHYNSCQGEYWDWKDVCKECHLNNNWKPNAETLKEKQKEVDEIIKFKPKRYNKH